MSSPILGNGDIEGTKQRSAFMELITKRGKMNTKHTNQKRQSRSDGDEGGWGGVRGRLFDLRQSRKAHDIRDMSSESCKYLGEEGSWQKEQQSRGLGAGSCLCSRNQETDVAGADGPRWGEEGDKVRRFPNKQQNCCLLGKCLSPGLRAKRQERQSGVYCG